MNLAYYRNSKYSKEETIENIKKFAKNEGFNILGELELNKVNGTLIQVCKDEWLNKIIKNDKNLVGLMPCGFLVTENKGKVSVGMGNPAVLGGVSQDSNILKIAEQIEKKLQNMLQDVTGMEAPKPKKVKLYSSTTCPYCVMEKEWLDSNKVEHEVVFVDKDQNAAQKMVEETGQMGVPVTEVVYEDNEKEFIVGFNKARLSSILGL